MTDVQETPATPATAVDAITAVMPATEDDATALLDALLRKGWILAPAANVVETVDWSNARALLIRLKWLADLDALHHVIADLTRHAAQLGIEDAVFMVTRDDDLDIEALDAPQLHSTGLLRLKDVVAWLDRQAEMLDGAKTREGDLSATGQAAAGAIDGVARAIESGTWRDE